MRSCYGKFVSGNFAEELGKTLTKFASNNPFPWYKEILMNQAVPQSNILGNLVMFGELLAGLLIVVGGVGVFTNFKKRIYKILLLLGLVVAFKFNLMFWLASGWTSPSSDSLNLLMLWIELVGIVFCLKTLRKDV